MNIIIYGGTGYLGTALSCALKNITRISIISRKTGKINPNLESVEVLNYKKNRKKINKKIKNTDLIIFSNGPSYKDSKKKLFSYISFLNKEIKIINKFRKKKTKIIYFSSIHVYENYNNSKSLTNSLLNSRSYYSVRNMVCEKLITKNFNQNEVQAVVIRIANIFGIPNNLKKYSKSMNNLAINVFCNKIIKNQKIQIKSNYLEKRNYVSVNDFIDFIKTSFIEKKINLSSIINYTSKKQVNMRQLVNVLKIQSKKLNLRNPKINFQNRVKKTNINYSFDTRELIKFRIQPKIKFETEIYNSLKKLNSLNK